MTLDENTLQVVMIGAVALKYAASRPSWVATVLQKAVAKYKSGDGNTLIAIYTLILEGLPAEVVVVLTTQLADNPVCVLGFTADMLGYELFRGKVLSDIQQQLDIFHNTH